jgi:hypothetical protein
VSNPRVLWMAALFGLVCGCSERERNVPAAATGAIGDTANARLFVQGFYDWYRRAGDGARAQAQQSDTLLAAELRELLKEDWALAGSDTMTPRNVLDGDPFEGQDPCLPFVADSVRQSGQRFHVRVRGACSKNPEWNRPFIIEVERRGPHWIILDNRIGGEPKSLMDWLCEYALADTRADKRPKTCGRQP